MYRSFRTNIGKIATIGSDVRAQQSGNITLQDVRVRGADVHPKDLSATTKAAIDAANVGGSVTSSVDAIKLRPIPSPLRSMHMRYRYTSAPSPPVTNSGYADVSAYIKAFSVGTSDLYASIQPNSQPFLYATIRGVGSGYKDVYAKIYVQQRLPKDLYASIIGSTHASTSPLEYTTAIVSTPTGVSIVKRLTTLMPDLTASIRGWFYSSLVASIQPIEIQRFTLYASIFGVGSVYKDLYAVIQSNTTSDISASLYSNPGKALNAILEAIPPFDLNGYLTPIPPSDLPAVSGGHLPSDLRAVLAITQPKPLYAYIVPGYSSTSDLIVSVTGSGGYYNLAARINPAFSSSYDLAAHITVRGERLLRGYITGWQLSSLYASISGVYSSDIGGYIAGYKREVTSDLASFIRSSFAGTSSLQAGLYGWISAHTTDKPYNYDLYKRIPFFMVGTLSGLSLLSIESIRGYFPDLHASITAIGLKTSDLPSYIVGLLRSSSSLSASVYATTKAVHLDKLVLQFYNISDLSASIWTSSDIKPLFASTRGVASTSTSSLNGYWVYRSLDHTVYLNCGTFIRIYRGVKNTEAPLYYYNASTRPDLWAYITGWGVSSLSASITPYPYTDLYAIVSTKSADHISSLQGHIHAYLYSSLAASISAAGSFSPLYASVVPSGSVSSLRASIYPYIKILGYAVIPVETKPYAVLRATIGPVSSCVGTSTYSSLAGFVHGLAKSTATSGVLYASIYSTTDISELTCSITPKRRIFYDRLRIKIRTQRRAQSSVSAYAIGVAPSYSGMGASITGDFLTSSLSATITAVRYNIRLAEKDNLIHVYKTSGNHMELYKTIRYYMSSGVRSYIYDELDKMVYPANNGKWVLRLETYTVEESAFFDRDTGDTYVSLGDIQEYDTVDEAIRAAIHLLINRRQSTLSASITASGSISSLRSYIYVIPSDKTSALSSSIYPVYTEPTLYASISPVGRLSHLSGYIIGKKSEAVSMSGSIYAYADDVLSASITGIT